MNKGEVMQLAATRIFDDSAAIAIMDDEPLKAIVSFVFVISRGSSDPAMRASCRKLLKDFCGEDPNVDRPSTGTDDGTGDDPHDPT